MLTLYRLFGLAMCGLLIYAGSIGWILFDPFPVAKNKPGGPNYYHK